MAAMTSARMQQRPPAAG